MSVWISINLADHTSPTTLKIRSFKRLLEGWHYGKGVPPTNAAIEQALKLNSGALSSGFLKTDAFPGIDGEILVAVYYGEWYLEFTLEANMSVTFVAEKNREEVEYVEGLSVEDALNKIAQYREKVWTLSGLSILSISTIAQASSRVWPLRIQVMGREYPVSIKIAPSKPTAQSAPISPGSILGRQASLPSFGKYLTGRFQTYASSYRELAIPGMIVTTT